MSSRTEEVIEPRWELESTVVCGIEEPRLGQGSPEEGQLAQADGPGFTLHPAGGRQSAGNGLCSPPRGME